MAASASPAAGSLSSASTQRVDRGRRDHQVDRPVEQLARAQPREAPQLALLEIAGLHALDQRVAQLGLGAERQQFQAGRRAPHLAQQRRR